MAVDKLVDSTQLNADLTSVANAIRTKGGTSASLAFPSEFVSAIEAIETGGGGTWEEETVTTSGAVSKTLTPYIKYNFTGTLSSLSISLSGDLNNSEYRFEFSIGESIPTLSMPNTVNVPDDFTMRKRYKYTFYILGNECAVYEEPVLPSAYTKVECISVPNGGYVNTNIMTSEDTEIHATMRLDTPIADIPAGSSCVFFGRGGSSFAVFGAYANFNGFLLQWYSSSYRQYSTKDNLKHSIVLNVPMKSFLLDYLRNMDSNISSGAENATLFLCARNNNGSADRTGAFTVWGYTHSKGGEYAIDLVPCFNGEEYGFYDTVSGSFFGNDGSGTFSEGVA